MGYVRLRPRPWPLGQDQAARARFREALHALSACPDEVELWFGDECGVLGDPVPRRRLAKKGSRPRLSYTGKHLKDNVIGAVRPRDGKFVSLILPEVNRETFQIFLDHLQPHLNRIYALLILDNASWHKAKGLNWGRLIPVYLPPYSPDLNPIERIWLALKDAFFSWFVAKDHEVLTIHLITALRHYQNRPLLCRSLCHR